MLLLAWNMATSNNVSFYFSLFFLLSERSLDVLGASCTCFPLFRLAFLRKPYFLSVLSALLLQSVVSSMDTLPYRFCCFGRLLVLMVLMLLACGYWMSLRLKSFAASGCRRRRSFRLSLRRSLQWLPARWKERRQPCSRTMMNLRANSRR